MPTKSDNHHLRVVAAMSGGVDSAVAAAILVEQGYEVVGVTMQLYNSGGDVERRGACCAGSDIADARRVAQHLGIPHYVLNYEARFRESVIDDFADTYLRGETPVPCIRCNERLKFRDLLGVSRDLGAEVLATGHYARRIDGPDGPELHTGADLEKDQSYFLFATTKDQLSHLRFPVGPMNKGETRALAKKMSLPVALKPDSQDICFVPNGNYAASVKNLRPGANRPGKIIDVDGRILGSHAGVVHFTVGQRKGLRLGGGEPLYVISLNHETAEVVVGSRSMLGVSRFSIKDINWLDKKIDSNGTRAKVRVRSTRSPKSATIFKTQYGAEVALDDPEEGVAPGQACVAYDGTRLIGGGWIQKSLTNLPNDNLTNTVE